MRSSDSLRPAPSPCWRGGPVARSAVAWAAASARSQPVDCVLAAVRQAGFDLEALREELEAQASRKRWLGSALPALDCREAAKFAALHPAA